MNIKTQLFYLLLILSIVLVSCESKVQVEQKVILVDNLQNAILDNNGEYTNVKILKTYPVQDISHPNDKAVNLYICKDIDSKDTIYVFDNSKEVPAFAKDTTIDIGVTIDKRNIKVKSMQVIVFVPKQFTIPRNAKYIFATLTGVGQ